MNWYNNNKQQGFSLLEILVAFSILALSLTILLNIFSSGVNTVSVANDYNQAVQIAESLMAKTGLETPLKTGQTEGVALDKYHWQVLIQPFSLSSESNVTPSNANLVKIKVIVHWGDAIQHRQIKLINLKLAPKNL